MSDQLIMHEIREMRQEMNARFDGIDSRLDNVESRLDRVDFRLNKVESRLDGVESRIGILEKITTRLGYQIEVMRQDVTAIKLVITDHDRRFAKIFARLH